MKHVPRPAVHSGFFALAVMATVLLNAPSPANAGQRIINGNQVATVSSEMSRRLDAADPIKGEKLFKQRCRSCHTKEQGGENKTGPNLWDVVGRKLGSKEAFNYSADMLTMNTHWGYEELDKFLTKPFKFVPSTRMTFPGLKKDQDRANLIAFLISNSNDPLPKPSDW